MVRGSIGVYAGTATTVANCVCAGQSDCESVFYTILVVDFVQAEIDASKSDWTCRTGACCGYFGKIRRMGSLHHFCRLDAGGAQNWQDWMLIASHSAMAIEALLYVRFFGFRWGALVIAALWTLLNDTMDYTYDIFPWLPASLMDHLDGVRNFTVGLTLVSILCAWLALRQAKRA